MSGLPTAVRESTIMVGHVKMRVYHLDDGRRIIDADDFASVMDALENGLVLTPETAAEIAGLNRP